MRRFGAILALLFISACGNPSPNDDVVQDDGAIVDVVDDVADDLSVDDADSATDDGVDVSVDDGGADLPDVDDVLPLDVGGDLIADTADLDLAEVQVFCTELTVEQDCAQACAAAGDCQVCVCNTELDGGRCEVVQAEDGAECQDGENCTRDDYCENGTCLPGRLACDCLRDSDCAIQEDETVCNGTLYCNKEVFPYSCDVDPLTVVKCPTNQNTQCLENQCDPLTGDCSMLAANEGETCTIISICVLSATCQEGLCAPLVTRNCNDDNPCTDDNCVEGLGCVRSNNSAACNDGSVCTLDDICMESACGHQSDLPCDNGKFCDGAEGCDAVTGCYGGTAPTCDDGNACTLDRCLDFYDRCFNDWIETAVEGPRGAAVCSDGKDNDCDGKSDIADPECLLAVDRVEPNDGVVPGGDTIVLIGNELDEVLTVLIGGRQAEVIDGTSLSLTVVTPAGDGPGPVDVVVSTELVSFTMVNGFTYTADAVVPGGECNLTYPSTELERDVGASIVVMTGQSLVPISVPQDSVMYSFGYGPRGTNPTITPGWMWTGAGITGQGTVGAAYQTTWSVFPVAEKGGYFDIAARLSTDGGVHWTVCDLDGSGNGYSPAQAPDLTVYGNADPGDVIINELMWPGTAADINDEWIELRNVSDAPIRVSGWKMSGVGYPAGQDFLFDAVDRVVNNEIIEGGGYYLIAQFDAAHSSLNVSADLLAQASSSSSRTLRLGNVGPRTYNLIDDREIVIDSAYFSAAFGMIGSLPFNEPYRSMERRDGHATGISDADWQSAWIADGWDGDPFQTMLRGTPRQPNSGISLCDDDGDCLGFHAEIAIARCQARVCDLDEGRCDIIDIPDGGACDDGAFCTVGETCLSAVCGNSEDMDCFDSGAGSLCTLDSCDEGTDQCLHTPDLSVREGPNDSTGCHDLVDNDCDGLTDTMDPQCLLDVTSISPTVVPLDATADGWTATVTGTGFAGDDLTVTGVYFRGTGDDEPALFSVDSATTITVLLPSLSVPGVYDVLVSDGFVTATLENAITFQGTAGDMLARISSPTDDLGIRAGGSTVYIRGRVKGDAIGTGAGMIAPSAIIAEVGYGPEFADPSTDHGWTWLAAAYESACVDCVDEYQFRRTVSISEIGVYALAYRFSVDGGVTWAWGSLGPYTADPWYPEGALNVTVNP